MSAMLEAIAVVDSGHGYARDRFHLRGILHLVA